jgi:hypothetical protein
LASNRLCLTLTKKIVDERSHPMHRISDEVQRGANQSSSC